MSGITEGGGAVSVPKPTALCEQERKVRLAPLAASHQFGRQLTELRGAVVIAVNISER